MRTAVGAPDPGEFERKQPHNIFNDRRVGGRAKNRAIGESYPYGNIEQPYGHSVGKRFPSKAKGVDNSQGIQKSREYIKSKSLPKAPKQFN